LGLDYPSIAKEHIDEHMDNPVRHSSHRMAGRLHSVSRRGRFDSPPAGLCGHLLALAFCDGPQERVKAVNSELVLARIERVDHSEIE
jgi:hypothetical protein